MPAPRGRGRSRPCMSAAAQSCRSSRQAVRMGGGCEPRAEKGPSLPLPTAARAPQRASALRAVARHSCPRSATAAASVASKARSAGE